MPPCPPPTTCNFMPLAEDSACKQYQPFQECTTLSLAGQIATNEATGASATSTTQGGGHTLYGCMQDGKCRQRHILLWHVNSHASKLFLTKLVPILSHFHELEAFYKVVRGLGLRLHKGGAITCMIYIATCTGRKRDESHTIYLNMSKTIKRDADDTEGQSTPQDQIFQALFLFDI